MSDAKTKMVESKLKGMCRIHKISYISSLIVGDIHEDLELYNHIRFLLSALIDSEQEDNKQRKQNNKDLL